MRAWVSASTLESASSIFASDSACRRRSSASSCSAGVLLQSRLLLGEPRLRALHPLAGGLDLLGDLVQPALGRLGGLRRGLALAPQGLLADLELGLEAQLGGAAGGVDLLACPGRRRRT